MVKYKIRSSKLVLQASLRLALHKAHTIQQAVIGMYLALPSCLASFIVRQNFILLLFGENNGGQKYGLLKQDDT